MIGVRFALTVLTLEGLRRVGFRLDAIDVEAAEMAARNRTAVAAEAPAALLDELSDQLVRAVRARLERVDPQTLRLLGPARQVAEAWAEQLPLAPSPLEDLTGPFYDTSSLRKWLGVTRQALDSRARHSSILALTTGDGTRVYPAWQWRVDKSTVPHLSEVLPLLLAGARDPWTAALWMTSPVDWGDGCEVSAWQWLDEGGDPASVLSEARADGARWAS